MAFRGFEPPTVSESLEPGWTCDTARALLHDVTPILKLARDDPVRRDGAAPFSYEESRRVLINEMLHRGCRHCDNSDMHYCALDGTGDNAPNSIVWHTQTARRNKYRGCAVVVKLSHDHNLPEAPHDFSVDEVGYLVPCRSCTRTSNLSFWQVVFGNTVKRDWIRGIKPPSGGLNVGAVILDAAILACVRRNGDPLCDKVPSGLKGATVLHALASSVPFDLRPFYRNRRAMTSALNNRVTVMKNRCEEGTVGEWALNFSWTPGEGSTSSNEINDALSASHSVIDQSARAICHGMNTALYDRLLNWRRRYISWCEAVENLDGPSFSRWKIKDLEQLLKKSLEQEPNSVTRDFDIPLLL